MPVVRKITPEEAAALERIEQPSRREIAAIYDDLLREVVDGDSIELELEPDERRATSIARLKAAAARRDPPIQLEILRSQDPLIIHFIVSAPTPVASAAPGAPSMPSVPTAPTAPIVPPVVPAAPTLPDLEDDELQPPFLSHDRQRPADRWQRRSTQPNQYAQRPPQNRQAPPMRNQQGDAPQQPPRGNGQPYRRPPQAQQSNQPPAQRYNGPANQGNQGHQGQRPPQGGPQQQRGPHQPNRPPRPDRPDRQDRPSYQQRPPRQHQADRPDRQERPPQPRQQSPMGDTREANGGERGERQNGGKRHYRPRRRPRE